MTCRTAALAGFALLLTPISILAGSEWARRDPAFLQKLSMRDHLKDQQTYRDLGVQASSLAQLESVYFSGYDTGGIKPNSLPLDLVTSRLKAAGLKTPELKALPRLVGSPHLHVQVFLFDKLEEFWVTAELTQTVYLERSGLRLEAATTWRREERGHGKAKISEAIAFCVDAFCKDYIEAKRRTERANAVPSDP